LFDSGQFRFAEGSQAKRTAQSIARALSIVLPCSVLDGDGKPFKATASCAESFYHNKNLGFVQSIYVEGHTDDVPLTSSVVVSNWDLSALRAVAIIRALELYGVAPQRMAAMGFGYHRPLVANTSAVNRAINRRVEILIRQGDSYQPWSREDAQ